VFQQIFHKATQSCDGSFVAPSAILVKSLNQIVYDHWRNAVTSLEDMLDVDISLFEDQRIEAGNAGSVTSRIFQGLKFAHKVAILENQTVDL
jgi:hypothetical protein